MSPQDNFSARIIKAGRERIKPAVHSVARRTLPLVERAAGTRYVRERNAPRKTSGAKSAGTNSAGTKATAAQRKAAEATAKAYRELAEQIGGPSGSAVDGWTKAPVKAEVTARLKSLKRLSAEARAIRDLAAGKPLAQALISSSRALLSEGRERDVVVLGQSFVAQPGCEAIGHAVLGLAYRRGSKPEFAWRELSQVEDKDLIALVPAEYYSLAIDVEGDRGLALLDEAIARDADESLTDTGVLRVAESAFCADGYTQVEQLISRRLQHSDVEAAAAYELRRLLDWLPGGKHRAPQLTTSGVRNFGILSYDQPGVRSRNIGDYIQTIASIGHLVRDQGLEFTGDQSLVDVLTELRDNVKPERKYNGDPATLNLVEVYRDGNIYQDIPEDTWYVAFGWYMHDTFGKTFNIPFHENLRPILLSVFVRYPEMLTPEAIDYLRKYGPVGCRDWQSVALLRAVGVPAFFSGCITTTVDTLFADKPHNERTGTLRVDWKGGGKGPSRPQTVTAIRDQSFTDNLLLARDWVADYAYKYARVLTSRLHANLPARSVGVEVDFRPKNRSDSRFGGLIGITDEAFDSIRTGILDKLETIIPLIASGASEGTIYDTWREITRADMLVADEYLAAAADLPVRKESEIAAAVAGISGPTPDAGVIDVYIDVAAGEETSLARCAASIDTHSTSEYRLWVAPGAISEESLSMVRANLRKGSIGFLTRTDSDLFGLTSAEALPALLPEIFSAHELVVVIPAGAEVDSDISELAAQSPAGTALVTAAVDPRGNRHSGLTVMRRIASFFKDDDERALQFVFASHRTLEEDFVPFDVQVMVLHPGRMIEAGIPGMVIGLMTDTGISYSDAMQIAVGGVVHELPRHWNVPTRFASNSKDSLTNRRGLPLPSAD